jgi:hypothetical protein
MPSKSTNRRRETFLMKNKILLIGAVVLQALLASVWAADITGKWIARMPGRQGTIETVFSFRVDGTKLTGTVTNLLGETAISEGKINGDEISFIVVRSFGGNEIKQVYKGKVAEDEIKFRLEMQGGQRGPGGAPQGAAGPGGGMGQPPEFIAKREFVRNGDIPLLKPTKKSS